MTRQIILIQPANNRWVRRFIICIFIATGIYFRQPKFVAFWAYISSKLRIPLYSTEPRREFCERKATNASPTAVYIMEKVIRYIMESVVEFSLKLSFNENPADFALSFLVLSLIFFKINFLNKL